MQNQPFLVHKQTLNSASNSMTENWLRKDLLMTVRKNNESASVTPNLMCEEEMLYTQKSGMFESLKFI